MNARVVLSVYFCGTDHKINSDYTTDSRPLAAFLHTINLEQMENQYKMGFDGCGITHGLRGLLFGAGLEEQCIKVEEKINELLRTGKKVVVNCYGHSRGGIACLMLAKRLGGYPQDLVEMNLAMLDPVPGNAILTTQLDPFNFSLANQVIDLSECQNLNKVLCLYPYEALPSYKFHTPILPCYPSHTVIEQDVILGKHSEIENTYSNHAINNTESNEIDFIDRPNIKRLISQARIYSFMEACGTKFHDIPNNGDNLEHFYHQTDENFIKIYDEIVKEKNNYIDTTEKECHSKKISIIKATVNPPIKNSTVGNIFLNNHHARLAGKERQLPKSAKEEIYGRYSLFDLKALLIALMKQVYASMSENTKKNDKGKIITTFLTQLDLDQLSNPDEFVNAMRNTIAVILQRQQYRFSLFSTTSSGEELLSLLKLEEYKPLSDLILGTKGGVLRYRDLRRFVIGKNNESYFNAANRDNHYRVFLNDEFQVTKNAFDGMLRV